MIEQAVKELVKQLYRDGKKPSYYEAEKQLRRGLISQVMEECRYNQTEAARDLGITRTSLRTYIKQIFTNEEIKNMGIGQ